jgi:hypothetical protein
MMLAGASQGVPCFSAYAMQRECGQSTRPFDIAGTGVSPPGLKMRIA